MKRTVACLLILMTAFASSGGAAASRTADCQDVSRYFEQVDDGVIGGMAELIDLPGFREHFAAADRKTDSDGPGFFALSTAEREAIIAYLGMPGDALGSMDDAAIPDDVRDLHDSATKYWTLMADMMEAVSDDGPSAAMPYLNRLDRATSDNLAAQQAIGDACADEVEAYAGMSQNLYASSDPFRDDLLDVWEDPDPEALRGVGYNFLFHAVEPDVPTATPDASTESLTRPAA